MKIPEKAKIQSADLKVRDLNLTAEFYSELLGLKLIEKSKSEVMLSADGNLPYLIKLIEDKNAAVRIKGSPGLYHIAFRFPNRKELARVFLRLFDKKIKFQGFSDHLVSEAIYLSDPEGNGIELYVDKPESEWKWKGGQIVMDSLPLDLSILTKELDDRDIWNGVHPDTDIGHIHLNVSNLFKAEQFYNDVLGMTITTTDYPGALFFAAGKYHHHIGANIWNSRNGKNNGGALGLKMFTVKIPDKAYLKYVAKNAEEAGLQSEFISENEIVLSDFDDNKIKVIL